MKNILVGSEVIWLGSHYTVLDIKKGVLILRQNFSINSTLTHPIPIEEVFLKKN